MGFCAGPERILDVREQHGTLPAEHNSAGFAVSRVELFSPCLAGAGEGGACLAGRGRAKDVAWRMKRTCGGRIFRDPMTRRQGR